MMKFMVNVLYYIFAATFGLGWYFIIGFFAIVGIILIFAA